MAKKEKKVKKIDDKKIEAKEKKENTPTLVQKSPFTQYKFWFKLFGAVLLLVLGVLLIVEKNTAEAIVLLFTGGVFILYGIIRFIPLVRTTKSGWAKTFIIIEVFFDILLGILAFYVGIQAFDSERNSFISFICDRYNVLIGIVLWVRAFIYFVCTVLLSEKTDKPQFFVHIALITMGSFLFGYRVKAEYIAIALAVLALIACVVLSVETFNDYNNYRRKVKDISEGKKKEDNVAEEKPLEAPAYDEDKDETEIPKDIPLDDPKKPEDRPYVN